MMVGINAYFAHTNDQGGVHGRRVGLTTLDDSYEPKLTEANTQTLIDQEVFALLGFVGTPTSRAVLGLVQQTDIPFLAPLTGAALLRDPTLKGVVNIRSSYQHEANEIVAYLQKLGLDRVAVFYQNDSYGRSGLKAARAALEKTPISLIAEGSYNRNTLSVGHALYEIAPTKPQAVIMVDAYKPAAAFIRRMREAGLDETLFFHLSFVNADALMQELGNDEAHGVFVSQVVPPPWDDRYGVVALYQEAMERYFPGVPLSFASLEGFMAARVSVRALELAGPRLSRSGFLHALEQVEPALLEDVVFAMSPRGQQGIRQLWITVRDGDKMVVVHEGIR